MDPFSEQAEACAWVNPAGGLRLDVVAELLEVGCGILVPAPQEKGKQGKDFGFLDLMSFESLDIT